MPRLTTDDFHPEVLQLFNKYVHGNISRRDFIDGASKFAVGAATGVTLLEALRPNYAEATQVQPTDPRIKTSFVELDSPEGNGRVRGYLVKPANMQGKLPGVLVVHENRGLNPHIQDVARRVALDNFVAFAPDALFTLGGWPGDDEQALPLFRKLDRRKVEFDCLAAANHLKAMPEVNGKVGATGFCFGGGAVNFIATRMPGLGAGVPFYGGAPAATDVPNIKAPLLINYADDDADTNAQWPAFEAALKAAGKKYEMHRYPGTMHGFNNDTTPRYNAEQAKIAWGRTIAFFNLHLRS
jgi:carboxymethylenebutenolidase